MPTESHHVYDDHRQIPLRHIRSLGFGSHGTVDAVERASDNPGDKLYARKVFFLPKIPRPRELDEILEEIKIARNLQHVHIVRLVETYQCEHTYAMIMEPVADGNLQQYLMNLDNESEHMDSGCRAHLSQWFGCLAKALAFLHARGILHRDIKPQNILTLHENVLLTDFGLSKEQEQTLSATTETRGTPTYRSPEQEKWRRPGRRSDIFSLGAVFLEMLTVCSGQRQLTQFRDFRGGPYCENIDNVYTWSEILSKRNVGLHGGNTLKWFPTMLFICQAMLQIKQERRPYADVLVRCWACQRHSGVPPTPCNCNAFPAGQERYVHGTLHQAHKTAFEHGDWLLERLLNAKLLNFPEQFLVMSLRE
ncbi:kinase-like protein [Melanomma pulvis-pyrius CBS 109.77]|uniref:Kinase-like protein n=1 Tax=Melanomma pulvis-pyrius CBS 109.77 TaxID=1314802 RepID=A0A6A6WXR1_9PLEO|nr:kinase-like protein [Melanomma pulvis-pyrius CBS 109.77]